MSSNIPCLLMKTYPKTKCCKKNPKKWHFYINSHQLNKISSHCKHQKCQTPENVLFVKTLTENTYICACKFKLNSKGSFWDSVPILSFTNAVNTFNSSFAYPVCSLNYTGAAITKLLKEIPENPDTQKRCLISTILALVRAYIDQRYILGQYDYKPAQAKNKNQMKGQDSEHLHFCRLNTLIKENALGDTNELYTITVPEELGQKTGTGILKL